MIKNIPNFLKKFSWDLYITRPIDLLTNIANARAYSDLKKLIGLEIKLLPYISKKGLVEYYREQNDIYYKFYQTLNNNPKKILSILENAGKFNSNIFSEIDNYKVEYKCASDLKCIAKEFKNKFINLQKMLEICTIIPYFVGVVEEKYKLDNKNLTINKIISLSRKLRLESYYPQYRQKVIGKILVEISKNTNRNTDYYNYLTTEEIIDTCLKKVKFPNISERKKEYFYLRYKSKEYYIFDKKKVRYIEKILASSKEKIEKNIIIGKIAFKGKIKGVVKIVYNEDDFKKFEKRNILVTINSHPTLIPVIQKCSAIIADEGGIASHASVISRELKIPCIVGTKNATKVLKDGDLVEVDANNGIVKIIKRAK